MMRIKDTKGRTIGYIRPITKDDRKEILEEEIELFKSYKDPRIEKDLQVTENHYKKNEIDKAEDTMKKIEERHKSYILQDFKNLMVTKIKPIDIEKYREIIDSLNQGDYNNAYYRLLHEDLISTGKWKPIEKDEHTLKMFYGWYCTGK